MLDLSFTHDLRVEPTVFQALCSALGTDRLPYFEVLILSFIFVTLN